MLCVALAGGVVPVASGVDVFVVGAGAVLVVAVEVTAADARVFPDDVVEAPEQEAASRDALRSSRALAVLFSCLTDKHVHFAYRDGQRMGLR